jgi:hypothetical protein
MGKIRITLKVNATFPSAPSAILATSALKGLVLVLSKAKRAPAAAGGQAPTPGARLSR